ncbi:FixH family protein [Tabrizicola sp.]|jgi:nitrogen fixation protein FixH|uniref:FixH family protein n=1 Tax=Tabrizicola sp. TaxID=2005166 RepID=UPI003D28B99D
MREITGKHVLFFTVSAFAVIIAVNLTMAYKAVSTFPGLEVKNSYVASQTFDDDRAAQLALGWSLSSEYDPVAKQVRLLFTDAEGLPVTLKDLSVLVGRTTSSAEDRWPEFSRQAGAYVGNTELGMGRWMLRIEARAADGTLFRQRIELSVRN